MNKSRAVPIEVNSDQLDGRLIAIEDRIASVEALLGHVHRAEVESLVATVVGKSEQKKRILQLCETPQSIAILRKELGLNTDSGVSNHIAPLRDNGLLRHSSTEPILTYEWSPMLRRLTKATRDKLLR